MIEEPPGSDRRRDASRTGKFTFPLTAASQIPTLGKDKICVVTVIGKSPYGDNNCKAIEIDGLLQRNIFQFGSGRTSDSDDMDTVQKSVIEGYHDADSNVLYLHLVSSTDTRRFVDLCRLMEAELKSMGFLHVWAQMKCSQANQLLFLFLISHIILVVHPVPTFDVSYLHLFRTLDTIRQKAHPHISEVLRDCPVSSDWAQAGRPCCPRVLFLFRNAYIETPTDDSAKAGSSRSSNKKYSPLKRLEHALEDQIYRILRKSRIITNISMNSLFAIPANQEFVYVQSAEGCFSNSEHFYLQRLQEHCLGLSVGTDEASKPATQTGECSTGSSTANRLLSDVQETEDRFKSFLGKHLELAFTKGFDDNVGRHSGSSVFELPTGTTWFKVVTKLHKLFFDNTNETVSKDLAGAMKSQIDIDGKFSELRCNKVLPVAMAAYQDGLPSHYSYEVHQSKLMQAYRMFAMHARGPMFERYATQLQEDCEKFWKNGHQLCEVRSLTGNPCLKPIHRLPMDAEDIDAAVQEGKTPIPVMPHCSQVKLMSVCNCGRKQTSREDPFDSKAANYDFYEQLAKVCCIELDRHEFPVFQPSISDYKAAEIMMGQWRAAHSASNQRIPRIERAELSVVAPAMSLALSLGQSLGTSEDASGRLSTRPEPSPQDIDRSEEPLSIPELPEACSSSEKDDKILIRQMSTTEYLPGMLHSESPAGLLPTFPSWSLMCLGPSSLYSHNIGIHDQPNFISGTNFLLPWDVTVKSEKDRWPTIAETSSRKGQHIPLKGKKGGRDFSEFTVKIFLGVEYECPRGHRFMCSAPDKILKASGTGLVKENASKITSSDMPLHFPCPCRSSKPVIAQLMRIHVVTPKAPVHVTLDPKVQPAPTLTPCPVFYPGNQEPVKLTQSTYWVLRLPFIYEGDQGPFLPPKDKKAANYGRLLKGLYNVTQVGPNI